MAWPSRGLAIAAPLPIAAANASVDMAKPSNRMEMGFMHCLWVGPGATARRRARPSWRHQPLVSPTRIGVFATAGQAEHVDEDASRNEAGYSPRGVRCRYGRQRGGKVNTTAPGPPAIRATAGPGLARCATRAPALFLAWAIAACAWRGATNLYSHASRRAYSGLPFKPCTGISNENTTSTSNRRGNHT